VCVRREGFARWPRRPAARPASASNHRRLFASVKGEYVVGCGPACGPGAARTAECGHGRERRDAGMLLIVAPRLPRPRTCQGSVAVPGGGGCGGV